MSEVSSLHTFCSQLVLTYLSEMRMLFRTIRKLVERRNRPDPTTIDTHDYLPWQSVSAFCFLRFIVPAILHPHLFGLSPGQPKV
jgi:hypothetical protein